MPNSFLFLQYCKSNEVSIPPKLDVIITGFFYNQDRDSKSVKKKNAVWYQHRCVQCTLVYAYVTAPKSDDATTRFYKGKGEARQG